MALAVHPSTCGLMDGPHRPFSGGTQLFMKRANHLVHYGFILLTSGAFVLGGAPTRAHSQSMAEQTGAQTPDRDDDATRRQLAGFDKFLDSHPEVAEQLRKNPSLVN